MRTWRCQAAYPMECLSYSKRHMRKVINILTAAPISRKTEGGAISAHCAHVSVYFALGLVFKCAEFSVTRGRGELSSELSVGEQLLCDLYAYDFRIPH